MFSDVTRHWANQHILALAQRRIINGYPDGTFRPNVGLTRAEFAALMTQVFPQLTDRQASATFSDVSELFWAKGAIEWVSQRGLFSGFEDGTFRPQEALSRLQAIIVLEAGLGASQPPKGLQPEQVAQQFSDAADIPSWAQRAIAAAIDRQLLELLATPRPLRPNQPITRAEAAALICRALQVPTDQLTRDFPGVTAAKDRPALFTRFLRQEAGFHAEKLAFLDRGIARSPYRREISQYASRLQAFGQPTAAVTIPLVGATVYPDRGVLPKIEPDGLDFLDPDIVSGCVCLATLAQGGLQARWLGRLALNNREMWSATKFAPLLSLVERSNAIAPTIPIDRCRIRAVGGPSYPFSTLAEGVVSYDNRIATSNALAATFKHFETPVALERWMRQATGNAQLTFRGRYGEVPFISHPQLWDTDTGKVLLNSPGVMHYGDNLVSTYDLTRLLTMATWHYPISRQANFASAQGHSLKPVLQAMSTDTARYIDVAIEALGLQNELTDPAIISKSGFGRSSLRDRTELSYCALVHFNLPRQGATDFTATHQRYALCMTLIAAKDMGNANEEARYVDALMAAEVTEILRRVVTNML
ncbi:MAG: S-layer homology domain-containing protein [Elainellaceae cyanobacterium]